MNSIDQYIQLYRDNRELIAENSAGALNARRQAALEALSGARLPRRGDEDYERTSIEDMFAPDYALNLAGINIPVDVAASFKCDVPNMSTWLGVTVNDRFVASERLLRGLPDGALFMSLRQAAANYPELIDSYYGSVAPLTDAGVALNTLLVQDGALIYIPRGVRLSKPMQLVNVFSSPVNQMAVRRLLVIVEEDAEGSLIVCDHTQDSERSYLSSQVIEIVARRGSRFDYYDVEESTADTSRRSQMYVRQESGSNVLINGMTLWNGTTRNEYHIDVVGDYCTTMLAGMVIGSRHQHADNYSMVQHRSTHSHSTQKFKYVLDEESSGAFEGGIKVNDGARFTEAYQSNKNLLASMGATMHTKPQLEIYNDDVKCSHGATTGQLDGDALFYMQSRGIPQPQARMMLMQAFMSDVIDSIRVEALRDRMHHLIEKRFAGEGFDCKECAVKK